MNQSFDKSIAYDPVRFAEAYSLGEKQLKDIRDLLSNKCSSYIRMSKEVEKLDEKFIQKISDDVCKCAKKESKEVSLLKRVEICYKDYESKHLDEIKVYLSKRPGFQVRKVKKYSLEMLSKVYSIMMKECQLFSNQLDINEVKKELVKQTCDCITAKEKVTREDASNSKIHVDCYKEVLNKNKSNIENIFFIDKMINMKNSQSKKVSETFVLDTQTELLHKCSLFLKSFDRFNNIALENLRNKANKYTMDSLDLEIKNKSLRNTFWTRGIRYLALGHLKKSE